MATKKISELEEITEADDSDVLAIVDVSEGKTNKITKNNLLIGSGHSIEMSLNQETYALTLTLKNAAGTELSRASIDLPNENSITDISYNNGKLTLTKQSGTTTKVDITGLINGLVTETALNNLANALKETIGIQTNTYDNTKTYNTGDIVVQNEKIYKANQDNITGTFDSSKWDEISLYEYQKIQDEAIEENYKVITKLQEDVEDLTERVEDAENNQLTYTPTPATSHYLQDSADSRFRKFIPIGRSVQDGDPTPENLVPIKNTGDNVNLFDKDTIANGAIYRSNGNIDSDTLTTHQHSDYIKIEGSTQYYITIKTFPSSNYGYAFYDNNKTFISSIASANLITTPANAKYLRICWAKTGTYASDINTIKLEQGSIATPYSPYGCGNVNEKVTNANIWDEEWELGGINNSNGENYVSTSLIRSKNYIPVNPNTQLYIKNGTDYAWFYAYDKNKNFLGYAFGSSSSVANEIKTTIANCYYVRFQCRSQYGTTYNNDICINVSNPSINGTYVPHAEQNLSFPLAQGQKLYEGDYLADDGVHHVQEQELLDGTQLLSKFLYNSNLSTENYSCFMYDNNRIAQPQNDTDIFVIADKLKGTGSNQRTADIANCWINHLVAGQLGMHVPKSVTTTSELRTYLANNPITFQYKLAEEVIDPYTEEQKTAWEEWKKARTYKNVTHISSEDEIPANVEIEYVVDINTIDDRITALEAKVDLLEE